MLKQIGELMRLNGIGDAHWGNKPILKLKAGVYSS